VSVSVVVSLTFQVFAVAIICRLLGARLFAFNGGVLVVMLSIYHGATEIAQLIFPEHNMYRLLVAEAALHVWLIAAGASVFVLATAYVWTLSGGKRLPLPTIASSRQQSLVPLLLIAVPSFAVVAAGSTAEGVGYWTAGLSWQMFLLAIVMAATTVVLRTPVQWTTVILVVEALLLGVLGSRLTVLAGFVMTAGSAIRAGRSFTLRHTALCLVVLGVVAVSVSATRAQAGREVFAGAVSTRVSSLIESGRAAVGDPEGSALAHDFVYRFDGNSFPALMYQRYTEGYPPTGWETLLTNLYLSVPSAVYADKLSLSLDQRHEEALLVTRFSLPADVDFTPTMLAYLLSYQGLTGLLAASVVVGIVLAWLDAWALRTGTVWSELVSVGVAYCCVLTEQGTAVYFLTFRGVLVLYLIIRVLSGLWECVANRQVPDGRRIARVSGTG
jgi:hypothetical protein